MRFYTVSADGRQRSTVQLADGQGAYLDSIFDRPFPDLSSFLAAGLINQIPTSFPNSACWSIGDPRATICAPYRNPQKIFGIGLNYDEHARDLLTSVPPATPGSFLKANHTIIGPDEEIMIPNGVGKVTAEAELGLVIGEYCYRVREEDALSYVAGVCAILDQTAEGVLMENPRFLTRAKNYPTFFSFGPSIVTMDEVLEHVKRLEDLSVKTLQNGSVYRGSTVGYMMFSPAKLLSFHSHVMPFYPGDILSTGTPGAAPLSPGDRMGCELGDGLVLLENPVVADS